MRKRKGFTFIELIVVVAIFGILLAIAVPTWTTYLQRAKIRTQNTRAKAIFNAAQTTITELDFHERKFFAICKDTSRTDDQKNKAKNNIYTPLDGKGWYYYWDGKTGYRCDKDGNKEDAPEGRSGIYDQWNTDLGDAIKRIVDDEMVYKIYVENYKVMSVVCAARANDSYLGAHPNTLFEVEKEGKYTLSELRSKSVAQSDMSIYELHDTP